MDIRLAGWTLARLPPQNVRMYLPSHFAEDRPAVLQALIRAYPLATLVWQGPEGLAAEHLPLEYQPAAGAEAAAGAAAAEAAAGLGVLRGHVARANPVWQLAAPDQEVLLVFQGPQAYVSPSWYPAKVEHGKVVPTWNYAVVHARGPLQVRDDPVWVHALVTRLTATHERRFERPWAVADAPADYIAALGRAIVGIEIPIRSLSGKWKVSQNRSAGDRAGVRAALAGDPDGQARELARLVPGPSPVTDD